MSHDKKDNEIKMTQYQAAAFRGRAVKAKIKVGLFKSQLLNTRNKLLEGDGRD